MLGAFSMGWLFLIIASIVMASGTVVLGIILCRGRGSANNQLQEQNLLAENVQNDNHNPVIANELLNCMLNSLNEQRKVKNINSFFISFG